MKKSPKQLLGGGLYYLVCILLAVVFAGPFLWMLSSSLKPADEILANTPIHV
jgi:ABC-type glycerol-3-phosphate transport system permease component